MGGRDLPHHLLEHSTLKHPLPPRAARLTAGCDEHQIRAGAGRRGGQGRVGSASASGGSGGAVHRCIRQRAVPRFTRACPRSSRRPRRWRATTCFSYAAVPIVCLASSALQAQDSTPRAWDTPTLSARGWLGRSTGGLGRGRKKIKRVPGTFRGTAMAAPGSVPACMAVPGLESPTNGVN